MELMPGRIAWAPEKLDRSKKGQYSVFDFCGESGTVYQVQHYTVKSRGRAFGPLGLRQTLEFCRGLRKHMVSSATQTSDIVELSTPPGDPEAHTNAAVLVGAYLILDAGFSVQDVRKAMGDTEAKRLFACSWARQDRPEAPRNMEVADCWLGLELARQRRWLPSNILFHDPTYFSWLTVYNRMAISYDATWIVPGSLIVSADPTTTAFDPNPATFSKVFPPSCKGLAETTWKETHLRRQEREHGTAWEADVPCISTSPEVPPIQVDSAYTSVISDMDAKTSETRTSSNATKEESDPYAIIPPGLVVVDVDNYEDADDEDEDEEDADDEIASTDTVCKAYTGSCGLASTGTEDIAPVYALANETEGFGLKDSGMLKPFVRFLQQDCKVGLIIRTNAPDEPGMTAPYDGKAMLDYDIVHQDIMVDDHKGGMPDRLAIQEALDASREYMKAYERGDVVLVHCKGGFGRSVVLASCLAIDHYDVSGRALLGWIRLARPGAVTTPQQEEFLRAQRGRADLLARLGGKVGAQPSCGCSLM